MEDSISISRKARKTRGDDVSAKVIVPSLLVLFLLGLGAFAALYSAVHAGEPHSPAMTMGTVLPQAETSLSPASATARSSVPPIAPRLAPAPGEPTSPPPTTPARVKSAVAPAAPGVGTTGAANTATVVRVEPNPVMNPYAHRPVESSPPGPEDRR